MAKPHKVLEVTSVAAIRYGSTPRAILIAIMGNANCAGWSNFALVPWIYINPPADGIYDFDLIGTPPEDQAGSGITAFKHHHVWSDYPDQAEGVRIHASSNQMQAFAHTVQIPPS